MNNKKKHYKSKRKVILIKYNDLNEKLIIKKTLKTTDDKITVEVKCNTKIRSLKEKKRIRDKYSLSKVQLRRRIVPCCLRAECRRRNNRYNLLKRENYREIRQISKDQLRRQASQALSPEKRNEVNNNLLYDDISSGSLTTYSDSEIESLIKSTRKRMRDSDKEWKMIPRSYRTSTPLSIKDSEIWISSEETNSSFDSLKTLILEPDDKERCDIKTEYHSPKLKFEEDIPESYDVKKIKLEPNVYNPCNSNQIKIENCEESTINAVVTKLERIEDSPEAFDVKAVSIKQELYGDL